MRQQRQLDCHKLAGSPCCNSDVRNLRQGGVACSDIILIPSSMKISELFEHLLQVTNGSAPKCDATITLPFVIKYGKLTKIPDSLCWLTLALQDIENVEYPCYSVHVTKNQAHMWSNRTESILGFLLLHHYHPHNLHLHHHCILILLILLPFFPLSFCYISSLHMDQSLQVNCVTF